MLLYKCKALSKKIKEFRPSRSIPEPSIELATNKRDFVASMIQLYTSHFESAFRILHIPSFMKECESFWDQQSERSIVTQHKVRLVVAIASSLQEDEPQNGVRRAELYGWINEAQTWVSAPMEKNRLSIEGLQVQCLLILSRQALSMGGDIVWIAVGTVLRTAMHLGLHRDPRNFTAMSIW